MKKLFVSIICVLGIMGLTFTSFSFAAEDEIEEPELEYDSQLIYNYPLFDADNMPPEHKFFKFWRVENVGTKTWTRNSLTIVPIDEMAGDLMYYRNNRVSGLTFSGRTEVLYLLLRSPGESGEYTGCYQLHHKKDNFNFGEPFCVEITVK